MKNSKLNASVPGDQFHWPEFADEKHRIKLERFAHFLGHTQVPDMNRIERAAHQTELDRCAIGAQVVEPFADYRQTLTPFPDNRILPRQSVTVAC